VPERSGPASASADPGAAAPAAGIAASIGLRPQWLLAPVVLLLHLLLLREVADSRLGWGEDDRPPPRIEVAFVRELAQAAPPATAPTALPAAPAQPRLPAVADRPAQPASAPAPAPAPTASAPAWPSALNTPSASAAELSAPAVKPEEPPPASPSIPLPPTPPTMPTMVVAEASGPAASAAPPRVAVPGIAVSAPPQAASPQARFDWPPSTRLSYRLTGDYRGPVEGSARVDWLRQGGRYQVRLESSAGPLFSRQVVSDGELTEAGLAPRRFTGEQNVLFGKTRRWTLSFSPERVLLPDGREVPAMAGAQDEASQFVQLTWLFTMQPERLKVGQSIEFPLAISRRLDRWTFDVVGQETLHLPFGAVEAFHVKPRREAEGGDMTAEIWFAPTLQYLPVRILIRQREHHVDLKLERPPLQATDPAQVPR